MTLTKRVAMFAFGALSLWVGMALFEVPPGLPWWQTLPAGLAIVASVLAMLKAFE